MNKQPKDLVEAVTEILRYEENISEIKKEKDLSGYHFTTGRWIRNNWGLWNENSDLHKFFNSIGVYHADDMSGIILKTVHRIVNGERVGLKEQINNYKKYWESIDCDMEGNLLGG